MGDQVLIQFRVDKSLKEDVSRIYDELGLDLTTALRMFLAKSRIENGLPFDARLSDDALILAEGRKAFYRLRKDASSLPPISDEEIEAEIAEVRASRKKNR